MQARQEQHPGLGTVSLACRKSRTQWPPRALSYSGYKNERAAPRTPPSGGTPLRTLKTPATRTTRTGRSAGRRVSWCLCIGRWVLETPAHQDQHGGVASTGPTGPRAEGPWVPVSKPTLLASPPAQVFSASTARLGSSGQSMWPSCHQRKERAGNIAALVD